MLYLLQMARQLLSSIGCHETASAERYHDAEVGTRVSRRRARRVGLKAEEHHAS